MSLRFGFHSNKLETAINQIPLAIEGFNQFLCGL